MRARRWAKPSSAGKDSDMPPACWPKVLASAPWGAVGATGALDTGGSRSALRKRCSRAREGFDDMLVASPGISIGAVVVLIEASPSAGSSATTTSLGWRVNDEYRRTLSSRGTERALGTRGASRAAGASASASVLLSLGGVAALGS